MVSQGIAWPRYSYIYSLLTLYGGSQFMVPWKFKLTLLKFLWAKHRWVIFHFPETLLLKIFHFHVNQTFSQLQRFGILSVYDINGNHLN